MENSIVSKIKNIRELKDYTQEYMAEQLGLTQSGYNKIEKGKTVLGFDKLVKIASVLEVSVEDIISFDGQKYFGINYDKAEIEYGKGIDNSLALHKFYENKIILLEELINEKESELDRYREKFGKI